MKPAILVVDDDVAVCELLQDVLSEHVFTVLTCHTGQDAVNRVHCAGSAGHDAAGYQRITGFAATAKAATIATGGDADGAGK